MTVEKIRNAPPQSEKLDRPARRYRGASPSVPPQSPVVNPIEYFNNMAKTMHGSGTILPHGGMPVEILTDVAVKMIVWPMEQWLGALYRGYEVMRSTHDAIQGLERRVESTVASSENRTLQGVQTLTNQSLSALGGFAQSPFRPFWLNSSVSKHRKDW